MALTGAKGKAIMEMYDHERRYYTVYDKYRRNYRLQTLAAKFYARHEAEDTAQGEYTVSPEEYYLHTLGTPKEKHDWPESTNQEYGWYAEPLVKIDVNDRRLNHPRMAHDFIKHYMKLSNANVKKEKFIGVPFLLQ